MAFSSFKTQYRDRPVGYRTPSPPPVEPLPSARPLSNAATFNYPQSDIKSSHKPHHSSYYGDGVYTSVDDKSNQLNGWSKGHHEAELSPFDPTNLVTSQDSPSRLDIFAAVATSPRNEEFSRHQRNLSLDNTTFHWNHATRAAPPVEGLGIYDNSTLEERPSKRLRTEGYNHRPPNGALNQLDQKPTTISNATAQDAELLLDFFHSSVYNNTVLPFAQDNSVNSTSTYDRNMYPQGSADQKMNANGTRSYEGEAIYGASNWRDTGSSVFRTSTASLGQFQTHEDMHMTEGDATTGSNTPLGPNGRIHKGWPKGKPRGTRQTNTKSKKAAKSSGQGSKGTRKRSSKSKKPGFATLSNAPIYQSEQTSEQMIGPDDQNNEAFKRRTSAPDLSRDVLTFELPPRPPSAPSQFDTEVQRGKSTKSATAIEPLNICAACNSSKATVNGYRNLWIGCDGCKSWFHYVCAGFKTQREVRDVDKFYCKQCEPQYGPTTYVRKSSRAHAALDYAGLNEGVIRTNDDILEHHFIKSIKSGDFEFEPENFARMPPELVTAEYFEACGGIFEPFLIPASMNPRPLIPAASDYSAEDPQMTKDTSIDIEEYPQEWFSDDLEYDCVPDDGQDKLDMVIPQGLTIRIASELYGPDQTVPVINVKNQATEDKRWTLRQWADYYEAEGEKPVRNVISLEFAWSRLGRLVRRPKIARDLDLQDIVWPAQEHMKSNRPKSVQFYCLMSVADSYTDFHIDFGGSSVYYHILKGKKTFFFIPPKNKHLKKYEDWCNSKEQNTTWLPDLTGECYRVDLSEGDTMIIPSGWIHAVWTPENSLVIGGNFLTRMHYAMQIKINEIEKATKTAREFRYPSFQKVMWFAVIDYLTTDPVPSTVVQLLYSGEVFPRKHPIWLDRKAGEDWASDPDNFNSRFYCQGEVDGLGALFEYVFRTVKITLGKIDGITKETQNAVKNSMPKGYGDHFDLLKTFALWVAWKRGNEIIPYWAYPGVECPASAATMQKPLTAAAAKRHERQVAHDALRATSNRPSRRQPRLQKPSSLQSDLTDSGHLVPNAVDTLDSMNHGPEHNSSEISNYNDDQSDSHMPRVEEKLGIRLIRPEKDFASESSLRQDSAPYIDFLTDESSLSVCRTSTVPTVVIEHKPRPSEIDVGDVEAGLKPETTPQPLSTPVQNSAISQSVMSSAKTSRSKACEDCRRSKRRCIHDANGKVDAVKASETPVRRGPQKDKSSKGLTEDPFMLAKKPDEDVDMLGMFDRSARNPTVTDLSVEVDQPLDRVLFQHEQPPDLTVGLDSAEEECVAIPDRMEVDLAASDSNGASTSTILLPSGADPTATSNEDDNIATPEPASTVETSGHAPLDPPATVSTSPVVATKPPADLQAPLEIHDTNDSENSKFDSKSRTPSPRVATNSTERTSHSRSSSPLTDVEGPSSPPRDRGAESPDELAIKDEDPSPTSITVRPAPAKGSAGRPKNSRNVSTRACNLSATGAPAGRAAPKSARKIPSAPRPKTPVRSKSRRLSTPSNKGRTPSATSPLEDEDMKLALQLAAEDRGLRRRG